MHLGQLSASMSKYLGIPEPTTRILARLLRDGGLVQTGARGRHAPHMNSRDVARFLIACMVAESPATGVERLRHFASLPLVNHERKDVTFEIGLSTLLERIAETDFADLRRWRVSVDVAFSSAVIEVGADIDDGQLPELHEFNSLGNDTEEEMPDRPFPFYTGMYRQTTVDAVTLFRIAKDALAGEGDPAPALLAKWEAETRARGEHAEAAP